MLHIGELSNKRLHKIRIACAYLFSPESAKDNKFINTLNMKEVKKAYKEKVKRYHPDLHQHETEEIKDKRVERFINIQDSYEVLISYLQEVAQPFSKKGEGRGKIIAVGGAKGGIGKSIIAANLGVLISSMEKKTVVADLDLGGANIHLYLGETYLKRKINDYLKKRVSTLREITIKNKYGPRFIGGDSSQLGVANINFAQKLKLLRDIKNMDVDYVIMDLGGDTSYNIIDFFLSADYGLVVTTCEPAAYLDAYRFIKVSLYRKLNRLVGPESIFRKQKDIDLTELIRQATISSNGLNVRNIKELKERIRKRQPSSMPLIDEVLSTFNPYLIVNKTTNNSDVNKIVNHIKKVSKNMLSIDVKYIGNISYQPDVEDSTRVLIPAVVKHPKGKLVRELGLIIEKLI